MSQTRTFTAVSVDDTCAHCARPVIGDFVQGRAGRYHPACTRSPYEAAPPIPMVPFCMPGSTPLPPLDLTPKVSWENPTCAVPRNDPLFINGG